MTYIIAIFIGLTIVLSMVQNSKLEEHINIKQVTFLNFITGGLGSMVLFIAYGYKIIDFGGLAAMPWYGYIGGIIGVIVVTTATVVMKHVSVITASMLMYSGQMLVGIFIDLLNGIDFSIGKIIGCVLIIIGVYFNSYIDKRPIQSNAY